MILRGLLALIVLAIALLACLGQAMERTMEVDPE